MKSRPVRGLICLAVAATIWLPTMHFLFAPRGDAMEEAHALLEHQTTLWTHPEKLSKAQEAMRRTNAEWDFMSRTYYVLALANLALREPEQRDRYLASMDAVIDDTLKLEREHGKLFFMMDYARDGKFVHPRGRSIFEDGEIALMLGARRIVQEMEEYRAPMRERIGWMEEGMRDGPVLCAESYPDECWTFCNAVALSAMKCADVLDGSDHREFFRTWVAMARKKLIEPGSGILISSFNLQGQKQDGAEGSSIWMIAHCLQIVDPAFAKEQYDLARRQLGRRALGFGYAREWPDAKAAFTDVDSGPVIPILDASPSSSGLALLGAAAFGDTAFLDSLRTSLNFGGFPQRGMDWLKYCGSNQVGDSVLLYALAQGPLWAEVERRALR